MDKSYNDMTASLLSALKLSIHTSEKKAIDRINELLATEKKQKSACVTCGGDGWILVERDVYICCGADPHGCGGNGCQGPSREREQQQDGCPDCGGCGIKS